MKKKIVIKGWHCGEYENIFPKIAPLGYYITNAGCLCSNFYKSHCCDKNKTNCRRVQLTLNCEIKEVKK